MILSDLAGSALKQSKSVHLKPQLQFTVSLMEVAQSFRWDEKVVREWEQKELCVHLVFAVADDDKEIVGWSSR